jgi:hypothetical protein
MIPTCVRIGISDPVTVFYARVLAVFARTSKTILPEAMAWMRPPRQAGGLCNRLAIVAWIGLEGLHF